MNTAVLFAGQGAQYRGMFYDLYKDFSVVRDIFRAGSAALDIDLEALCFFGDEANLVLTKNLQPCILACDIAAWEIVRKHGVSPSCVAGFSLGEYAALYAAGCISLKEVFEVISVRAQAMQDAVPVGTGGMAAIMFSDAKEVDAYFDHYCDGRVWISNYNTYGQYTIAGYREDVEIACAELKEKGVLTKVLPVSAPFHCPLMDGAKTEITAIFEKVEFRDAKIPIVMNYDGAPESNANSIKEKTLLQTVSPVQWIKTLDNMRNVGITTLYECGPGKTLAGFARKMQLNMDVFSVGSCEELRKIDTFSCSVTAI